MIWTSTFQIWKYAYSDI